MKRILVVDDDLEQRDLYAELFDQHGYKTVRAYDGADALEKIKHELPDLVFTGIMMPRMNGFELISHLRENPATATVPVIVFSHLNRDDDRQKTSQLPFTYFMAKGFNRPAEILARVRQLLGDYRPSPTPSPVPEEPPPPANLL